MGGDFTLIGYSELIQALQDRGYGCVSFSEARADKQHLILRHDIDFSVEAALPIAKLEHQLGVHSTFFVLPRTNFYNLRTPEHKATLNRICSLGHSIGLHFDASNYDADDKVLDSAAKEECEELQQVIGQPVAIISFHRPSESLLGRQGMLGGRSHTYEPRYFRDMGYCSDSRGAWHHGHPLEHPALSEKRALQFLTHPIWWYRAERESPVDRLNTFASNHDGQLKQEIARNCEPYNNWLSDCKKALPAGSSQEDY